MTVNGLSVAALLVALGGHVHSAMTMQAGTFPAPKGFTCYNDVPQGNLIEAMRIGTPTTLMLSACKDLCVARAGCQFFAWGGGACNIFKSCDTLYSENADITTYNRDAQVAIPVTGSGNKPSHIESPTGLLADGYRCYDNDPAGNLIKSITGFVRASHTVFACKQQCTDFFPGCNFVVFPDGGGWCNLYKSCKTSYTQGDTAVKTYMTGSPDTDEELPATPLGAVPFVELPTGPATGPYVAPLSTPFDAPKRMPTIYTREQVEALAAAQGVPLSSRQPDEPVAESPAAPVARPGTRPGTRPPATLSSPRNADISTESAKIQGTIYNDRPPLNKKLDSGEGIAGVVVSLLQNGVPVRPDTQTSATGSFSISGLAAGIYTLRFGTIPNFSINESARSKNIKVDQGSSSTFDLRINGSPTGSAATRGSVTGRVYKDVDFDRMFTAGVDTPLTGIPMTLMDAMQRTTARATSGSDGTYNFGAIPVGAYTIQADLSNQDDLSTPTATASVNVAGRAVVDIAITEG